ncbi:hypothetical protein PhaeoP83_02387 [Phaeobacter inhibens]|uniref:Uncharacterized protein n=1 Tax=Phaeobacter inhibens TaxID=221822 RepID=A0ABM6RFZ1_9RHOB|nr:hypothetical protein PhaeoP83_02387 [Phaeobacter inhibens]AUQ53622.1 hypothetical protein PhaeoP92_00932 [Phaeobacter inhibens]AUQ57872.1 hypothetical protein PhaeoP30_00944 [Phaeobacter inhibens]AUQ61895.1 hypothetical protein PhaeoP51_00892 [Phaeobacter inhibens]AUQ69816.1 hypothetical protein PhaeoP54_00911 [Phaeobacter inhibens]
MHRHKCEFCRFLASGQRYHAGHTQNYVYTGP